LRGVPDESRPAAARAPDAVRMTALSLKDFRNYAELSARFGATLVVLGGPNGAGKTNLLEAISLLTPGRGLRRAALEDMTRRGEKRWAVAASVERNGVETRIGTGLGEAAEQQARTRKVRINGAAGAAEDLLQYLRVLWLTPGMDGLFTGPPGDRRRFLDRLVLSIDPAHARRARDFERLLAQRNRLLEERAAAAWLDAVEIELAAHAVAIAFARAEAAALLSARLAHEAGGFPAGRMRVAGAFEERAGGLAAAAAETWYRGALAEARPADRAARRTLLGPHRSDIEVTYAPKEMPAAQCSTGEQKALLVGIVLSHAALVAEISGMKPVLLLDEVAAHLDPDRRAALFHRLEALGCQTFMTGTDLALFSALPRPSLAVQVVEGRIAPAVAPEDT
jgi:DNA replication and repair protein RecF